MFVPKSVRQLALPSAAVLVAIAGCSTLNPSTLSPPGRIVRTHAQPVDSKSPGDWDPAAVTVTLDRVEDTTPVGSDQVYVATVRDKAGKPLVGRRVEWVIAEGTIGDIVQVDEAGWSDARGYKVNNQYAVSHTNTESQVLDRGTDDPSDDILVKAGQTWCVITSPVEGQTHLSAYAPAIDNWSRHTVKATHTWFDVAWEMPGVGTNPTGTARTFTTRVFKHSDGSPLADYLVRYEFASGPAGGLGATRDRVTDVYTDAQGIASTTITQDMPIEGTNEVVVTIIRPENTPCCTPSFKLASAVALENWVDARIALSKAAPIRANAGDTFVLPITISNPSPVDAVGVVVTDPIDEGLEFVSSSPPGTIINGVFRWDVGTLRAGVFRRCNVTVRGIRSGVFGSNATVMAEYGLTDTDYAETRVVAPSLALTYDAPSEALTCDGVSHTITVTNTGDGLATDVEIVRQLSSGFSTADGRLGRTHHIGTLEPGQAKQVSFIARPSAPGSFVSKATVKSHSGLGATAEATTVVKQPHLAITKVGPDERFMGRNASYEITVTNVGDTTATNTTITDTVPPGMSFVSATNGGSFSGREVLWNLAMLKPGESVTVKHTLRATQGGLARSTAWVRANCADASTTSETNVRGMAGLSLEMVDSDDPIEVGDFQTYIIKVTNQSGTDATSVRVVCELPVGQMFVSGTGPSSATSIGSTVTFAVLPSLPAHKQAVYRVSVKSEAAGDVRFKVMLASDQLIEPVVETESTFMY